LNITDKTLKVTSAKLKIQEWGVLEDVKKEKQKYYQIAMNALNEINVDESMKHDLRALANQLIDREF